MPEMQRLAAVDLNLSSASRDEELPDILNNNIVKISIGFKF